MQINRYKIRLEYFNDDGLEGYSVDVPALPGAITWGKTRSHALEMAQECIEGHVEVLQKLGEPVPPGDVSNEISDEMFVEVSELATVV